MYYEVSKEVFGKLPNFVVGVVAVTGINNNKEYPAIEKMLVRTIPTRSSGILRNPATRQRTTRA